MIFPFITEVRNEEETAAIADMLSEKLNPGQTIILNGNLGAGKTFFVKKICSRWGISNVNSPTFAIVNEYNGRKKVYHFDFYRINSISELLDIGFNDYLNDEDAVIFIEWGNLMEQILPEKRIEIDMQILSGDHRKISILNKEYE